MVNEPDATPAAVAVGPSGAPNRRRLWVIIGIIALVLVAAVGILLSVFTGGTPGASPTSSASSTPTSSSTPTPTPTPSASPTAPATAPPTAPAEAPVAGPGEEFTTDFGQAPAVAQGLTVHVTAVNAIEGTSNAPGEIAGPALQFVIEFVNNTGSAISLAQVVVNSDYSADRTPAGELEQDETSPVPGEVGPNSSVSGSYVFNVPTEQRDLVRLLVYTNVDAPTIAFEGPAPR